MTAPILVRGSAAPASVVRFEVVAPGLLDVPKKKLPSDWNQTPVADGDSTDDLYEHPAGVIVGLAVKGRTAEIKEAMARTGFARAA